MGAQHSHSQSSPHRPQRHESVCGSLNIVDLELAKRDKRQLEEELAKLKSELEKTKRELDMANCQLAALVSILHD